MQFLRCNLINSKEIYKISKDGTEMFQELWTECVHKTTWIMPYGVAGTNL